MVNLFLIIFFSIFKVYSNSASNYNQKLINFSISFNNNSNFIRKNLIIGVLTNYRWEDIASFIISYSESGFEDCDCIIFVYKVPQSTVNKIKSFGVIVYDIPEEYRNKKIINSRWKIYEDFLFSNRNKYNLVLTTDLRDVFFQTDFFKYYKSNKSFLGVALEDGILSESLNRKWLINAYGKDLYNKIKNQRIICVGTIWGTIDKLIEFSKIMWEKLDSEWSLRFNVIEQAVANYLIYYDKMFNDCLIKSENKNGPIMTIGLTNAENIYFDVDGNIVNGNGKVAAVIHQYDRKPKIKKKVLNKYNPNINIKKEVNYYSIIILFLIFIIIILNIIILQFLFKDNSKKKNFNIKYPKTILKAKDRIKNNNENLDNSYFLKS